MLNLNSIDELRDYIGRATGSSPWIEVTQERINKFDTLIETIKDEDGWYKNIFVTGPGFHIAQVFVENVFDDHVNWIELLDIFPFMTLTLSFCKSRVFIVNALYALIQLANCVNFIWVEIEAAWHLNFPVCLSF